LNPDGKGSVPVIAMTAFVTQAAHARLVNRGFRACLEKPFTAERLLAEVLAALGALKIAPFSALRLLRLGRTEDVRGLFSRLGENVRSLSYELCLRQSGLFEFAFRRFNEKESGHDRRRNLVVERFGNPIPFLLLA
jgi:hypothetical protein